ncbi:MAG: FHA domain-containing protein [Gammaproteobacteria bacterium]|nr:FHA domain-containing protein [Gammaproteobacteria bacterium]
MGWEIRLTDLERGGQTNRSFSQTTVRVGRHSENELVLQHNQISRVHLTLTKEGERYFAEDSSRNGSFLKRGKQWARLDGKTELQVPATIRVADWSIRVDYQAEEDWDKSVIIPAGHLVKRSESIMVFDLCESSRIASEDDHMAHHLKTRVQQLADPVLTEYGMRFFKGTGDGFLATFSSATRSVTAALELVNRIKYRNSRTTNPPIHYRISLHHGETWGISTGGQDIHGNDVNIAFRIEGVQKEAFPTALIEFPKMDRILCSKALIAEITQHEGNVFPSQTSEIGAASLKGIQDPTTIFQIHDRIDDSLRSPPA